MSFKIYDHMIINQQSTSVTLKPAFALYFKSELDINVHIHASNVYLFTIPLDVVVFENRFPSLSMHARLPPGSGTAVGAAAGTAAATAAGTAGTAADLLDGDPLWPLRPGTGRCEVVCFIADHTAAFSALPARRVRTVVEAWCDRTAELSRLPGIEQVFCFENRGQEIGVTLHHPHGQIYAYPFVTPRSATLLHRARAHRRATGGHLLRDVLDAERRAGVRVVLSGEHWTAYVPAAARWPVEVHLAPHRDVPDLPALTEDERDDLAELSLELLRRCPRSFDGVASLPYIAGWHQAPVAAYRDLGRLPPAADAQTAKSLVIDANGSFIVSLGNSRSAWIQKFRLDGTTSVLAGKATPYDPKPVPVDGPGSQARFIAPLAMAFTKAGALYVGDASSIITLRKVGSDGSTSTLPLSWDTVPTEGQSRPSWRAMAVDGNDNLYTASHAWVPNQPSYVYKITPQGAIRVLAYLSPWFPPFEYAGRSYKYGGPVNGLVADAGGNVYAAGVNGTIVKINPQGTASLLAGNAGVLGHQDGQGSAARFSVLGNMTLDADGNLYVVDGLHDAFTGIGPTIRKITPAGVVSTAAGRADLPAGYVDGPAEPTTMLSKALAHESLSHVSLPKFADSKNKSTNPKL